MKKCIKCGSHAFNLYAEEIDQGGFCDVHYWKGRAHRAEAQLEQAASITKEARGTLILHSGWDDLPDGTKFYTTPPKQEPRNFCPRCGKRTADLTVIHTCTPPEGGNQ